jgi:hypothetical protein
MGGSRYGEQRLWCEADIGEQRLWCEADMVSSCYGEKQIWWAEFMVGSRYVGRGYGVNRYR